jgi:hypothetical protein
VEDAWSAPRIFYGRARAQVPAPEPEMKLVDFLRKEAR